VLKLDTATGDVWIMGSERDEDGHRAGPVFFPVGVARERIAKPPAQNAR